MSYTARYIQLDRSLWIVRQFNLDAFLSLLLKKVGQVLYFVKSSVKIFIVTPGLSSIVAPELMDQFGLCFFCLKVVVVESILNYVSWQPQTDELQILTEFHQDIK